MSYDEVEIHYSQMHETTVAIIYRKQQFSSFMRWAQLSKRNELELEQAAAMTMAWHETTLDSGKNSQLNSIFDPARP